MAKFKKGDKVKLIRKSLGIQPGKEYIIRDEKWFHGEFLYLTEGSLTLEEHALELVNTSPKTFNIGDIIITIEEITFIDVAIPKDTTLTVLSTSTNYVEVSYSGNRNLLRSSVKHLTAKDLQGTRPPHQTINRLQGLQIGKAFIDESDRFSEGEYNSIKDHFTQQDADNCFCDHEFVNVGFTSVKMVCKKCNVEQKSVDKD